MTGHIQREKRAKRIREKSKSNQVPWLYEEHMKTCTMWLSINVRKPEMWTKYNTHSRQDWKQLMS